MSPTPLITPGLQPPTAVPVERWPHASEVGRAVADRDRGLRWLLVADGASVHTSRFAAALLGCGVDVHLATHGDVSLDGVRIHDLGPRAHGNVLRLAGSVRTLRAIVARVRPDVVNAHYVTGFGLLGAASGHPRVIQTAWGSDLASHARGLRGVLTSVALRRAWRCMADSDHLMAEVRRRAPHSRSLDFIFGPPSWLFSAERRKESLVLSPRGHEAHYQVDRILDAWQMARAELPGHRLVVAGEGSLTPLLRRDATPDVDFAGQLAHDNLLAMMLRAATVVSIPRWDSSSASVLEAMAAGCGVVASDLPANRQWLPEDRLVPVDCDAGALAEAIVASTRSVPLGLDPGYAIERQAAGLAHVVMAALP